MKNSFALLRSRGIALKSAVVAAALAAPGTFAQTTDWKAQIPDLVNTELSSTLSLVGPAILGALVASVGIKLVKRFTNKI